MIVHLKKIIPYAVMVVIILALLGHLILPGIADRIINRKWAHAPFEIDEEAALLHDDLFIMDWHADTLLWPRNLNRRSDAGHVDLPRLRDGNIAVQMFTTVTKSPAGQNVQSNSSDSFDTITPLVISQAWPIASWTSLFERALFQSAKLERFVDESKGGLRFIKTKTEFQNFLIARQNAKNAGESLPVAALLGTEGGHPFEGKIDKLEAMFQAGFRMFGLTHFFDNELGGSLHGETGAGLSPFGVEVVKRLDALGGIIDLAHASPQMARDVLALSSRPVVISHTGFYGNQMTNRNFKDDLMVAIAQKGGLIAVGLWAEVIGAPQSPEAFAKAVLYGINLVGEDHVALGSDWDGAVETIASSEIAALTDALLRAGISHSQIKKVMGENARAFLLAHLPD